MLVQERTLTAPMIDEGAGAKVRRLFPSETLMNFDPFVLFDEFFLAPSAGFPQHPHRGFEAVTYLVEGGFHHEDTMGNDTTVCVGGVQYFSAGRGIEHSEMPGTEGMNHGIQLWVNLPQSLKSMVPEYHQVDPQDIPEQENDSAIIRTIVGINSPVVLHTHITYLDIILKAEKDFNYVLSHGHHGFIYGLAGVIETEDGFLQPGEAFFLAEGRDNIFRATVHSRCVLLSGAPHHQPIFLHGSFVD